MKQLTQDRSEGVSLPSTGQGNAYQNRPAIRVSNHLQPNEGRSLNQYNNHSSVASMPLSPSEERDIVITQHGVPPSTKRSAQRNGNRSSTDGKPNSEVLERQI